MKTDKVYIYQIVEQSRDALLAGFRLALSERLHEDENEFALALQLKLWVNTLMNQQPRVANKIILNKPLTLSFAFDPDDPTLPIGLCTKIGKQFSLYVKPQYRRLGIGSALLGLMRGLYADRNCYACEGIPESIDFFIKNRMSHYTVTKNKFSVFEHYRLKKQVVMTEKC